MFLFNKFSEFCFFFLKKIGDAGIEKCEIFEICFISSILFDGEGNLILAIKVEKEVDAEEEEVHEEEEKEVEIEEEVEEEEEEEDDDMSVLENKKGEFE